MRAGVCLSSLRVPHITVVAHCASADVRGAPRRCGDGGGSNSPSKALAVIASTSVAGGFFSRGPERAPARSGVAPGRWTCSRLPVVGGLHLRCYRSSQPAERGLGERSLFKQRERTKCCQLSGCRSD